MANDLNISCGGNFFTMMDDDEESIEGWRENSNFGEVGEISSLEPVEENDTHHPFANKDENEKCIDRKNDILNSSRGDQSFENIDDEDFPHEYVVFEDNKTKKLEKEHSLNEFLNHNVERDLNDMNYIHPKGEQPSEALFSSFEKVNDPLKITKNNDENDAEINSEFSYDPHDNKFGEHEMSIDDDYGRSSRRSRSSSRNSNCSRSSSSSIHDDEFENEGDIFNDDDDNNDDDRNRKREAEMDDHTNEGGEKGIDTAYRDTDPSNEIVEEVMKKEDGNCGGNMIKNGSPHGSSEANGDIVNEKGLFFKSDELFKKCILEMKRDAKGISDHIKTKYKSFYEECERKIEFQRNDIDNFRKFVDNIKTGGVDTKISLGENFTNASSNSEKISYSTLKNGKQFDSPEDNKEKDTPPISTQNEEEGEEKSNFPPPNEFAFTNTSLSNDNRSSVSPPPSSLSFENNGVVDVDDYDDTNSRKSISLEDAGVEKILDKEYNEKFSSNAHEKSNIFYFEKDVFDDEISNGVPLSAPSFDSEKNNVSGGFEEISNIESSSLTYSSPYSPSSSSFPPSRNRVFECDIETNQPPDFKIGEFEETSERGNIQNASRNIDDNTSHITPVSLSLFSPQNGVFENDVEARKSTDFKIREFKKLLERRENIAQKAPPPISLFSTKDVFEYDAVESYKLTGYENEEFKKFLERENIKIIPKNDSDEQHSNATSPASPFSSKNSGFENNVEAYNKSSKNCLFDHGEGKCKSIDDFEIEEEPNIQKACSKFDDEEENSTTVAPISAATFKRNITFDYDDDDDGDKHDDDGDEDGEDEDKDDERPVFDHDDETYNKYLSFESVENEEKSNSTTASNSIIEKGGGDFNYDNGSFINSGAGGGEVAVEEISDRENDTEIQNLRNRNENSSFTPASVSSKNSTSEYVRDLDDKISMMVSPKDIAMETPSVSECVTLNADKISNRNNERNNNNSNNNNDYTSFSDMFPKTNIIYNTATEVEIDDDHTIIKQDESKGLLKNPSRKESSFSTLVKSLYEGMEGIESENILLEERKKRYFSIMKDILLRDFYKGEMIVRLCEHGTEEAFECAQILINEENDFNCIKRGVNKRWFHSYEKCSFYLKSVMNVPNKENYNFSDDIITTARTLKKAFSKKQNNLRFVIICLQMTRSLVKVFGEEKCKKENLSRIDNLNRRTILKAKRQRGRKPPSLYLGESHTFFEEEEEEEEDIDDDDNFEKIKHLLALSKKKRENNNNVIHNNDNNNDVEGKMKCILSLIEILISNMKKCLIETSSELCKLANEVGVDMNFFEFSDEFKSTSEYEKANIDNEKMNYSSSFLLKHSTFNFQMYSELENSIANDSKGDLQEECIQFLNARKKWEEEHPRLISYNDINSKIENFSKSKPFDFGEILPRVGLQFFNAESDSVALIIKLLLQKIYDTVKYFLPPLRNEIEPIDDFSDIEA